MTLNLIENFGKIENNIDYKCIMTYIIYYLSKYMKTKDIENFYLVKKLLFNHNLMNSVFSMPFSIAVLKEMKIACFRRVRFLSYSFTQKF